MPTFSVTHSKTDDQLLDLIVSLRSLFGADPSIMSRSKKKPIFEILWKAFMNFLDKNKSFVIKNSALDLLAVYISLDQEHTTQVINIGTEKETTKKLNFYPFDSRLRLN